MAKSPAQMMSLFRQFADQNCIAANDAINNRNIELAALNIGQSIKSRLMEGMIGWRSHIIAPSSVFQQSLDFTRSTLPTLDSQGKFVPIVNSHLGLSKSNFMACLLGDTHFVDDATGIEGDLLLDCVLANGLFDRWDADLWAKGIKQLQRHKGTDLAVKTYGTYHDILHSSDVNTINAAIVAAVGYFDKRRSNSFFSGGDQINGGGLDNALTVDFRLSAVMKKREIKSGTVHDWLWEDGVKRDRLV